MSTGHAIASGVGAGNPAIIGASPREHATRTAIANAAAATGIDFDYLLAQAKLESALDPQARARTSSASGLYQFIESTWLETLDRHGERFGLSGAAQAIELRGGRAVADPAQRARIMALRFDPDASAMMAGALASDNREHLTRVLGREPGAGELYLAHFLGAGGAEKFLTALAARPDHSAAALLPRAAAANRAIFYAGGQPRSLQGVMSLIEGKMAGAMEGGQSSTYAPLAAQFAQTTGRRGRAPRATIEPAGGTSPAARPSMAEVLRDSFAVRPGASGEPNPLVQRAYDRLAAFGL